MTTDISHEMSAKFAEIASAACESPEGGNFIAPDAAISGDLAGLRMFAPPIAGVASAVDSIFDVFKQENVIGPHHTSPHEWLPEAESVISLFFPFTERVNVSNTREARIPSAEWLHARIEGQVFINRVADSLVKALTGAGYAAVAPSLDGRFTTSGYTSNWSERHAAYACGLGTFGLSRGLITKRGVAGRFTSIVTALSIPATKRTYVGTYDWCSMCGACAKRCPEGAISLADGKSHPPCSNFLNEMKSLFAPRYGCGKCQSGVPCQSRAFDLSNAK